MRILEFSEIAKFRAVIQIPYIPNAAKLSDVYATLTPLAVPNRALALRWVFVTEAYVGLKAPDHWRKQAHWMPKGSEIDVNRKTAYCR